MAYAGGYSEDRMVFGAVRTGIAIGFPLGMAFGMFLMWLAQLTAGLALDPVAIVLAGGYGGFMAGVFFGAVTGVATKCEMLYRDELEAPAALPSSAEVRPAPPRAA